MAGSQHNIWGVGLLIGICLVGPARAETTKEAIKAFGLIGTWSPDCTVTEDVKGSGTRIRLMFAAPFFGAPTLTLEHKSYNLTGFRGDATGPSGTSVMEIQNAERLKEDILNLAFTLTDTSEYALELGNTFGMYMIKVGNQMRIEMPQRSFFLDVHAPLKRCADQSLLVPR